LSDNGTEYTDQAFVDVVRKNGIEIGRSAMYTPQQNGRAERENRTLIEMVQTMLLIHGMSKRLGGSIKLCGIYFKSLREIKRERGKTPHEAWFNREYSFHHLKIFGSECFVRIPKQKRDDKKFGKTSKRGIFVGYEDITGNYRAWISEEKRIEISRDVEFREIAVPEALIDLSQAEQGPEAKPEGKLQEGRAEEKLQEGRAEEKLQEEHTQEENQEKRPEQPMSTYRLRNRDKIKAPQKFTYLFFFVRELLLNLTHIMKHYKYRKEKTGSKRWMRK